MVRAYHPDWPHALGLTYAAMADPTAPLVAEPGQPVAWTSLDEPWASSFPDDIDRIRSYGPVEVGVSTVAAGGP
jgi:8-oxo-dGTP diphosphatase